MDEYNKSVYKKQILNELQEELDWVKYRINMLNIIEKKLCEIRSLAQISTKEISQEERLQVSKKIKILQMHIKALNEESRY
ncbi:hypothetical protein CLOACE_09930 [Clostridium acetireducens DSM 10703]|uniref:Uncharacterized protein n=1 Tax=Clostridium acetireducens DSM 10703 TaxID=1121290 RepID=A0A1E8EZE4_9CLOT|nr:hypothetical protein [Clostridium acetireducens]OFI06493.1 hypothetical protein CLOACE_09930 [Clostridium acetireducens DSM 10703]